MSYLVTHGIGAVAIDEVADVKSALDLACRLLSGGELDCRDTRWLRETNWRSRSSRVLLRSEDTDS